MSVLSTYKSRCNIVFDSNQQVERRLFAVLELFCHPVSFLTILAIPVLGILKHNGITPPEWFISFAFPVLLAAAIGYITNWLAIEMIFKPYERTLHHPFAWLTLGYWKQGLVPKNKAQIAETVGATVSKRLLKPEDIANDICGMLWTILGNKEQLRTLQLSLAQHLTSNDDRVRKLIGSQIRQNVSAGMASLITADTIQRLWDSQIEPRLKSECIRNKMAEVVKDAIARRTPDIASNLRPEIIRILTDYCLEKGGPMFGPMLVKMVDGLADRIISEETVANFLRSWLDKPDTLSRLGNDLALLGTSLRDVIQFPDGASSTPPFADELRALFKTELDSWLDSKLAPMISEFLSSEQLTDILAQALEDCRPQLENYIHTHGMPAVMAKLDLERRIRSAIDKQDMAEFHAMVNSVAAQHLGAIQVLGFILGGLVGACMKLFA